MTDSLGLICVWTIATTGCYYPSVLKFSCLSSSLSDNRLEGSVCRVAAYLVVSDEGLEDPERDDMKKDVSVGADCIDWGVLPCLEPIAVEQVMGLQRQWLSHFVSKC